MISTEALLAELDRRAGDLRPVTASDAFGATKDPGPQGARIARIQPEGAVELPLDPQRWLELGRARQLPADVIERSIRFRTERIYGDDDRLDLGSGVLDVSNGQVRPPMPPGAPADWFEQVKKKSRSVALVLTAADLVRNDDGTWQVQAKTYQAQVDARFNKPLCAERSARFASQHTAGRCTGWLVAPDRVMTAGHCLQTTRPADLRVLFGWRTQANGAQPDANTRFSADAVYAVSAIAGRQVGPAGRDRMILVLDRGVRGADVGPPLGITASARLPRREPLYMLGHPRGLPLKLAAHGVATRDDADEPVFFTTLDAFQGNSGSPVFSGVSHQVVGMLVAGLSDLRLSADGACVYEVRRSVADGGEAVLRASRLPSATTPP